MAEADWTFLDDSIGAATVERNVTAGVPRPNGGGSFIYGFNSLTNSTGAVGLFTNQANFTPMAKGGRVTGAVQRGLGPFDQDYTPMLYILAQGSSVTDQAYLLGLSDADPARIVLRKGIISAGIPDLTPDPLNNGNLMASNQQFSKGTWVHLRLDAIVNDNGDVILQVFANDLNVNTVGSPIWEIPAGMEGAQSPSITGFVDDALQVNTGTAPFLSGRVGFAFAVSGQTRRGYFDQITVARQL